VEEIVRVTLPGTSVQCCNTDASVSSRLVIPVQADQPGQVPVSDTHTLSGISVCVLKGVSFTDTSNCVMQTPYLNDNSRSASEIPRHT
jgi:hypothetical protein